ncbi:MFS transporter [Pseudobacteriovorax antillogorgiicola]|uniref:Nitrate/nitrite transporter NarK n=1 Tax=Pseudobacteriovorax antillogorgiicola TaxID=1513793 RepID=A0A1Y6C038_9BACT|nr:MFS transporter [Pseudobacteriovorax antillogorgiicola]TCS52427.1 nitrate/nitrite transporter NarK [Pseudobacteriovorax antillogorgiicola]SMF28748.1 Nitrate/nitrite transporter NarK [Pseudobacteriovorax antillogorgiicola]
MTKLHSLAKRLLGPPAPVSVPRNYYKDLSYQLLLGSSQPLLGAIAVIIIKQVLDGSNQQVALIQAGSMAGLLLSLPYTKYLSTSLPQKDYALPQVLAWIAMILAGFAGDALWFSLLVFLALALFHISSPCQGVLYQQIYEPQVRGTLVGRIKQWQLFLVMGLSWLLGHLIDVSPESYHPAYVLAGILGFITCFLFMSIDTGFVKVPKIERPSFLNYLQILFKDRKFSLFMAFQFLLGIANISGVAVFQVYINDKGFLGLSPDKAALLAGVLPPLAMFLSIRFWGGIFDRINIVQYRVITSIVIGLGFIFYPLFGFWGAFIGSIIWGIGRGGGQLAWSIGILDFAPEGQSSTYLSIHTFLTGVRGVIAPFLGVWALETQFAPQELFWMIATIIFLSAALTGLLVQVPTESRQ